MQFRMDAILGANALRQYALLLDECFSVPASQSFLNDFPVWNPSYEREPTQRLGFFQGDELLSAVSVRIAEMKTPRQKMLKVAIIGGVATQSQARGLGLASRGVQEALKWSMAQKATIALLWGSEVAFYQRLGFEPCGFQLRVPLGQLGLQPKQQGEVRMGWNPAIYSQIQDRLLGLKLGELDRKWFESHQNVEWFWVSNRTGAPIAYAALGRGIDLGHTIHEWGGDADELNRILSHIFAIDSDASLLLSPQQLRQWNLEVEPSMCESLALAQVLRPVDVLQAYFPESSSSAEFQNGLWKIQIEKETYSDLSSAQVTQLFLGSRESLAQWNSSFFPVLWWIWGLDAA